MYVYSYNPFSEGAKALSQALGCKRIKHEGSKFRGRGNKVVINWGSSVLTPEVEKCVVLNSPSAIAEVSNKLRFFQLVEESGLSVPEWTTDQEVASGWLTEGATVVVRKTLTGHSGAGIEIVSEGQELPRAPLYTKYVKKSDEYRVHVFRNQGVVDTQRKARKLDVPDEEVNWKVRNLAGGFIYQRNDIVVPGCVHEEAQKAFDQTNLDFGAVDVMYNAKQQKAYVLEINSAPGLSGTTLENYVNAFNSLYE